MTPHRPKNWLAMMMTTIIATGCIFSESPCIRGTSSAFSTICTPRYSAMTHGSLAGSSARVTSTPAAPPIHGPIIGTSSVMPANMPRTYENGTPSATRPIVTTMPTTTPSVSCPRM